MFDKTFQKEKRRYQRKWQVDIDNFNANNPIKLWEELNKLKPRKRKLYIWKCMMRKVDVRSHTVTPKDCVT